jgi:hypothetical protein
MGTVRRCRKAISFGDILRERFGLKISRCTRAAVGTDVLDTLSVSNRLKRICRSNIFFTVVTVPIQKENGSINNLFRTS